MFSSKIFTSQFTPFALALMIAGLAATSQSLTTPKAQGSESQQVFEMVVSVEDSEAIENEETSIRTDVDSSALSAENALDLKSTQIRRPEDWQSWPIVPEISETMLEIYERGLNAGHNSHAFSKIGDGEISAAWFLSEYDLESRYYDLGEHPDLQTAITYFAGSFGWQSQAARRGFNTQSVLDPSRTDSTICLNGETPLDCEIRLHNPAFALISMGTNQVWQPELFEHGMRQIIERLLTQDIVPVLSTKADNLEGNHRINLIIARLGVEYELPVWNFWRAVQLLPSHGLQADFEHLTYYPNNFSSPQAMQFAWPVRNLSALQTLDTLMKAALP